MDFSQAIVNGVPLVLVIWGLVAFAKSLGVAGRWLTVLSMGLGLLGGVAYQVSVGGVPGTFAGWFSIVIYGLALGLVASGLYDVVKRDWLPQVGMGELPTAAYAEYAEDDDTPEL